MDPHRPHTGQMRPILPFYSTITSVGEAYSHAQSPNGFDFSLDHEDEQLGHPSVSRLGAYRRGFRHDGPEIGEAKNVNG
jgi:hypothetical protein